MATANRAPEPTAEDMGRYYGYPQCCIEHFQQRWSMSPFERAIDLADQPLRFTGYVACIDCRTTKTVDELIETIESRRECPQPFRSTLGYREWLKTTAG